MKFEDSPISNSINYRKCVLDFCTYYVSDKLIIIEVNEGEHFGKSKIELLINDFIDTFSPNSKMVYISNRIHSYSSEPVNWTLFDNEGPVVAAAIVSYRQTTKETAFIEKQISNISLKRATSLEEAINWALSLNEIRD